MVLHPTRHDVWTMQEENGEYRVYTCKIKMGIKL